MAALVAACGSWPSRFGGWMPPWWSGGHPRGTTGPVPAQGRRAATPWCFPAAQTETTGTSENPPKGVCCAGSITGQANPSQTSEHQCHVTLSFVPPVPSHPLDPVPNPHVPLWKPKEGMSPPCHPQPCCHPLEVAMAPPTPRGRKAGSARLCWWLRPGTREQRNNVPLLWAGARGHCGDITGTPGPGEKGQDDSRVRRGMWSDTCQSISVTQVTNELGEMGDPTRLCWGSPM